jgi:hypothetical protein
VQPGVYAETVSIGVTGTSGNPITFIADGSVTNTAWTATDMDYIRIIGFTVDRAGTAGSGDNIILANCEFIEVWNCLFKRTGRQAIGQDANSTTYGNTSLFIGNSFESGVESRWFQIRGTNNLVAYNTFHGASQDFIYWKGLGNYIINNYGYDANADSEAHVDFLQTGTDDGSGNSYTTVEANFYVDSDTPGNDHHFGNMSNGGNEFTHLLMRRNVIHQIGTVVYNIFQNWSYTYAVHESFLQAMRHDDEVNTAYGLAIFNGADYSRTYNCIAVEMWGANQSTAAAWALQGTGHTSDYNLAWDLQGTTHTFANPFAAEANSIQNDNPDFTDYANDVFTLTEGSPAIGTAGALTLVNNANGTGTAFDVDDAGYFRGDATGISQYSGNLIVGDKITVGTDQLTIASIAGTTITVTESFTWADNDPVYYGWDTTPDIGAYPYGHVPLTAATYSASGSNYTVTPDGDTRFVVFYEDGIPMEVDNAAPYTYSAGAGTVTARAYPLYASKTTSVLASSAGATTRRITAGTIRAGTVRGP